MLKSLAHISSRYSIRTLLIFFTISLIFVIISTLTVFTIWNSSTILEENSRREMTLALKQSRDNLTNFIELREANLNLWGVQPIVDIFFSNPELHVLTEPGIRTFFSKMTAHKKWLQNVILMDQGKILYNKSNNSEQLTSWFTDAGIKDLFTKSEPSCFVLATPSSMQKSNTILFIKRPFIKNNLTEQGKFLIAMINLDSLQDTLLSSISIGNNGFVFLVGRQQNQQLYVATAIEKILQTEQIQKQNQQWSNWSDIPSTLGEFTLSVDPLDSYPLAVVAAASKNDIKKPIYFLILTLISAGLIVLAFGIGATVILSRTITRPLVELLATVKKIKIDKLERIKHTSNLSSFTEVRILHQAFANMIGKLIGSSQEIHLRNEELKELGHSLRLQRNYLQTTLSSIGEGVITTDISARITFINPVASKMLSCTQDKLIDTPLADIFHLIDEKNQQTIENPVEKTIKTGRIEESTDTSLLLTKDGRRIPIDSSCAPIRDEQEKLYGVVLVFRDVSIRREAEKLIRDNEERFRILFENNPVSIWLEDLSKIANLFDTLKNEGIQDIDGYLTEHPEQLRTCSGLVEILDVNQTTLEMYEAENKEDFFRGIQNLLPPESEDFFKRELIELWNGKTSIQAETVIKTLAGEERNVAVNCSVVAGFEHSFGQVLLSITDITEQKKLEEQLYQVLKMETIGTLAGGVAHDYNNMLSVILGHSEMALNSQEMEKSLHESLSEIHKAAKRSAEITRQLLAFARKQTISPQILNLNRTVEGMLKMLNRLIGENIELVWSPSENDLFVKMDPAQIDQLLVNLSVNGRDAITDVGKITIETSSKTIDDEYCIHHAESVPGDFAALTVTDNGCGMNREVMSKIFEPFFTTKSLGRGTGLGLATVYGIAKQNNGFVNVYSEPGQGSSFKVYIPIFTGDQMTDDIPKKGDDAAERGECILVVEDEVATLKITQKMLTQLGYSILPAKTPNEALSLAKQHADNISLLITDVIMPEMNGVELAEQIQTILPEVKRLYMSGYTANVITHQQILDEGVFFLEKPFSKTELAAKVRAVLDADYVRFP